jgi:hypothetical protein
MVLFTLVEYLPIVDFMPTSFTQRGFSTQKYFKPEVDFEVNPLLNIFVAISMHPLNLRPVKQSKNLIKELLNIYYPTGKFPLHNWVFLNNYYKVNPTGQWVKDLGYRKEVCT